MCTTAGPNVNLSRLYIVLIHVSIHLTEEVLVRIKLVIMCVLVTNFASNCVCVCVCMSHANSKKKYRMPSQLM